MAAEDETLKQPSNPTPPTSPRQYLPKEDTHAGDTIREFIVEETTPPSSPSSSSGRSGKQHDPTPADIKPLMVDPTRLLNQYVLVTQVGQGGMGSVWKAWDTKLARYVAVKFLNATEDESIRRFQREAQLAARLRHPNICAIFEVNEGRGLQYLVMEFIDGTSIGKSQFPLRTLIEAMSKVCRALDFAHKNAIIHRDIKPANIMISHQGEPSVTDFGLAKLLQTESSISVQGSVLGTPAYMPPEQATGKIAALDAKSDIYSLGATLYMLLAGRAPFEAENATALLFKVCTEDPVPPRKLNPKVPAALEAITLKAMDKDKRRRYETAGDMANDLDRYLNDQPVMARPPGMASRAWRKIRRNPLPTAAIAAIVLAGLAVAGVFLRPKPVAPPTPEPTAEEKWQKRWDDANAAVALNTYREQDKDAIRALLDEMPPSLSEKTAEWFQNQLKLVPDPDKSNPGFGPQVIAWCSAVRSLLQGRGGALETVAAGLEEKAKEYELALKTTPEEEWTTEWAALRDSFLFARFLSGADWSKPKDHLAAMPAKIASDVAEFFQRQIDRLPSLPDKSRWLDNRDEARKVVDWTSAIAGLLEGQVALSATREIFEKIRSQFLPVTTYRGKITLRVFVLPYASVKALRCGDAWIIRDGKVVGDARVDGSLDTPLVIEGLDIGDYRITLANAERGDKEVKVSGESLKNGSTCTLSGSIEKPEQIRLR